MLRIDHIFCSPSVEVVSVEVPRSRLNRTASDHLPVVMDFRIADLAHIDSVDAAGTLRRRTGLQANVSTKPSAETLRSVLPNLIETMSVKERCRR
jgi:hypothetical protein